MKLSTTVVAYILLSVVYSQTIQSEVDMFPSCALTCLTNAISAAGCSITDYACQCGTRRSTIAGIATPCVVSTCSTTDAINTQKIGQEICVLQAAQNSTSSSSAASAAAPSSIGSLPLATTSANSSMVSSIVSSIEAATTTSTFTPTTTTKAASSSSSSPTTISKAAGSRLEAAGAVAGAAILAAFAL